MSEANFHQQLAQLAQSWFALAQSSIRWRDRITPTQTLAHQPADVRGVLACAVELVKLLDSHPEARKALPDLAGQPKEESVSETVLARAHAASAAAERAANAAWRAVQSLKTPMPDSPQIQRTRASAELLLRVMARGFVGRTHDEPEAALAYIALCLSTLKTHRLSCVFLQEGCAPALQWLTDRSRVERARRLFPLRLLRIASRLAVRLGHIDRCQFAQASTWLRVG